MQRLENRKVLSFFHPDGKTSKGQQLKVLADDRKAVSIVCTWFHWYCPLSWETFNMSPMVSASNHFKISFPDVLKQKNVLQKVAFEQNTERMTLASSDYLIVSKESVRFLEDNLRKEMECSVIDVDEISVTVPAFI